MKNKNKNKNTVPQDFVHPFIAEDETFFKRYNFSVEFMEWLLVKFHPVNRKRDAGRVEAIKADILNGDWNPRSGNEIRFDVNGNVIDGQHRLRGHVELNIPMISSVLCGLPVNAIEYIDSVRPRSASSNAVVVESRKAGQLPTDDAFKAKALLYRIAKWYNTGMKWKNGEGNARRRLSPAEIAKLCKDCAPQFQFAQETAKDKHTRRPGFLSALAMYFVTHPHKAIKFRNEMFSFNSSPAVEALREYLLKPSSGGDTPMYDHNNTVHAINCFHLGKPVGKLPHAIRTSWAV